MHRKYEHRFHFCGNPAIETSQDLAIMRSGLCCRICQQQAKKTNTLHFPNAKFPSPLVSSLKPGQTTEDCSIALYNVMHSVFLSLCATNNKHRLAEELVMRGPSKWCVP